VAAWRIPKPDTGIRGGCAAATAAWAASAASAALGLGLRRRLAVVATAEPDLGQPLQQRHPLLFRAGIGGSPAGAKLVLRRHRQFIDPAPRRARARAPAE